MAYVIWSMMVFWDYMVNAIEELSIEPQFFHTNGIIFHYALLLITLNLPSIVSFTIF